MKETNDSQVESALAALRVATHARHESLESLLQLTDRPLGRDRYISVLLGFELFLRAWEPRLRAALPASLTAHFDTQCRLSLVRADLAALGVTPLQDSAQLGARLPLPDTAAALGSWYVLAGSALGGQVIARQVSKTLGYTPAHGAAYFHGWGAETGRRWRGYRALLAAHVTEDRDIQSAADAAVATFDLLSDVFQRTLNDLAAA